MLWSIQRKVSKLGHFKRWHSPSDLKKRVQEKEMREQLTYSTSSSRLKGLLHPTQNTNTPQPREQRECETERNKVQFPLSFNFIYSFLSNFNANKQNIIIEHY